MSTPSPSSKTIILTAPQGWGKSRNAQALCHELGCSGVWDKWRPGMPVRPGALHLTNVPPAQIPEGYLLDADMVSRGWS